MRFATASLCSALFAVLGTGFGALALGAEPEVADDPAAQAEGLPVARIVLDKQDVFDLSDPREDKWLYRLANRLHIITRDDVIENQLLLRTGEPFSRRLADESERILRANSYLYDADITPTVNDDGSVDLLVHTKDVWTLQPILSLSRKGGENETTFGFEDYNLLGRGQTIRLERREDVDRTSNLAIFRDPQIGKSWWAASLQVADNSDGDSQFFSVNRPFFALDTRWSAGFSALDDDRRQQLYVLGDSAAEYRGESRRFVGYGGWSKGLVDGRVKRYTVGVVADEARFSPVADGSLPAIVPADREFYYPFIGIEVLEDRFETSRNRQQIDRTEDIYMGTRWTAQLGYASESFGSNRDAVLYSARYGRGFGDIAKKALLIDARASGRVEDGDFTNSIIAFDARYFRQQSKKRVFYMTLDATLGDDLDLDNPVTLGGDTGLRGYPLRYQTGDSRFLFSAEQRYFWNWYPFRLFRVGGAIFADIGRTWGDNPVEDDNLGWLKDVGIGLRFSSTRSGVRKVIHFDIAFPLDGDPTLDDVQIQLESRRNF